LENAFLVELHEAHCRIGSLFTQHGNPIQLFTRPFKIGKKYIYRLTKNEITTAFILKSATYATVSMKLVKAVIQPFKLEEAKRALESIRIPGMTVTEIKGYGQLKGAMSLGYFEQKSIDFSPNLLLEVVVNDQKVQAVVNAIVRATRTGKMGDGKIFILPVEDVIRIRTGESGESAL